MARFLSANCTSRLSKRDAHTLRDLARARMITVTDLDDITVAVLDRVSWSLAHNDEGVVSALSAMDVILRETMRKPALRSAGALHVRRAMTMTGNLAETNVYVRSLYESWMALTASI
jgi:hypothetical protein